MSYKYQKGGTPDHVNSDDSNSTAKDDHGLSVKADATATNIPKSAMSADDKVKVRDSAKAEADKYGGDGFNGMFADNRAKMAQEDLDKANSKLPPTMRKK